MWRVYIYCPYGLLRAIRQPLVSSKHSRGRGRLPRLVPMLETLWLAAQRWIVGFPRGVRWPGRMWDWHYIALQSPLSNVTVLRAEELH